MADCQETIIYPISLTLSLLTSVHGGIPSDVCGREWNYFFVSFTDELFHGKVCDAVSRFKVFKILF
ncbi:MAG: hypothetical protein K1W30_22220 [Lachnospiraceae bacterium]